jgi:hypothetical protein
MGVGLALLSKALSYQSALRLTEFLRQRTISYAYEP